jgi:pimeloyl-ACP methyl ester carboxylesterase
MKLVLMPGLNGTAHLFDPLIETLPPQFSPTVITYPTNESLSYVELLGYVREKLSSSKEYVLLAESFSGPIAVQLAATRPSNLKALILCATFVSNPVLFPRKLGFLIRKLAFSFNLPQVFIRRYLLGENVSPLLIENFRKELGSVAPEVLADRARSLLDVNACEALKKCRVPMLYLSAKKDKLVKRSSLSQMRSLKPEMEWVEIDGPHLLLQREPGKCVEAIEQFVGRVVDSFDKGRV